MLMDARSMPNGQKRRGIIRGGNAGIWRSAGWKILRVSIILFTVMGFLASFAAMQNGGVTFNGVLVEGWIGVWYVTGIAAVAGFLFGAIWLLLFKAMSMASKN